MKLFHSKTMSCLIAGAMLCPGLVSPDIYAQRNRDYRSNNQQNTSMARPARGNTATRPGNNPGSNRPGKPGNNNNNHRPGNNPNPNRPGRPGNSGNHHRPGNNPNSNRPGKPGRPGNDRPGHKPGYRPGNSAPQPGFGNNRRPRRHYYPPRPPYGRPKWHFGAWHPLPPPPPRPLYYHTSTYNVPVISTILGLTFGTLLDYGIRSLVSSGYTVSGYQDNAIFLNNVGMLGYTWPQATVYYGDNGMNGALFQYRTSTMGNSPYNKVYSQLCRSYGDPVESVNDGTYRSATWWGGNNTGYVTLTVQGNYDTSGNPAYDTNLIYGTE